MFVDVAFITAKLAGVEITEEVVAEEIAKSKEFKAKSLTGKFPVLETENGTIVESAAIARYIAKQSANGLAGANNWEAAQIDQFIDFTNTAIYPHIFTLYRAVFGWAPVETEVFNNAVKDLKEQVRLLNTHL